MTDTELRMADGQFAAQTGAVTPETLLPHPAEHVATADVTTTAAGTGADVNEFAALEAGPGVAGYTTPHRAPETGEVFGREHEEYPYSWPPKPGTRAGVVESQEDRGRRREDPTSAARMGGRVVAAATESSTTPASTSEDNAAFWAKF